MKHCRKRLFSFLMTAVIILATVIDFSVNSASAYAGNDAASMIMGMSIKAADGKTYKVSDFTEDYIVLLFGNGVSPCMDTMAAEAYRVKKGGVSAKVVLLASMEFRDKNMNDAIENMAKEYEALASVDYLNNNKMATSLLKSAGKIKGDSFSIPATFVLDKSRNLVYIGTGSAKIRLNKAMKGKDAYSDTTVYSFYMRRFQSDSRDDLKLVNALRTGNDAWAWNESNTKKIKYQGLKELTYDYGLEEIAMQRAAEIAVRYSHTRPNGEEWDSLFPSDSSVIGESIGMGSATSNSCWASWKGDDADYESQADRREMLSSQYKYIGIACVEFDNCFYHVMEFSDTPLNLKEVSLEEVGDAHYVGTNGLQDIIIDVEILDSLNRTPNAYSFEGFPSDALYVRAGGSEELPRVNVGLNLEDHVNYYFSGKFAMNFGAIYSDGIEYQMEPEGIAIVDGDEIKGLKKGECELKVILPGWPIPLDPVKIVVWDDIPAESIVFSQTRLSMKEGETGSLTVKLLPENTTASINSLTWGVTGAAVSLPKFDSKTSTVTFTAKKAGKATVRATLGDMTATCEVTVVGEGEDSSKDRNDEKDNKDDSKQNGDDYIEGLNLKWNVVNGKSYWYENGYKQGTLNDPKGVMGTDPETGIATNRGREICDNDIKDDLGNGTWFWLDSVYDGAKAVGKEVWMPYIYQDEKNWDEATMRDVANESDPGMEECVFNAMRNGDGKWVRYDENGKMMKGWVTISGELASYYPDQVGNVYYYDYRTGLMAKGWVTIDGVTHHFDETSGVLQ